MISPFSTVPSSGITIGPASYTYEAPYKINHFRFYRRNARAFKHEHAVKTHSALSDTNGPIQIETFRALEQY